MIKAYYYACLITLCILVLGCLIVWGLSYIKLLNNTVVGIAVIFVIDMVLAGILIFAVIPALPI